MIRVIDKDMKYGLNIHGNRWAAVDELMGITAKVVIGKENKNPAGAGMPIMGNGKEMWTDAGDNHTIVFGSTGSKKTRLIALPTIMCLADSGRPESMIITDPKGELYSRTAHYLKYHKGYDIKCVNLRDISSGYGNAWNPLTNIYHTYKTDKAKGIEMIADFTSMIMQQSGSSVSEVGGNSLDPFWNQTASSLLGVLMVLLFDFATSEKQVNIKSLVKLCTEYGKEGSIDNNDIYKIVKLLNPDSLLYIQFSGLFNMAEKTRQSVQASLYAVLSLFLNNEKLTNLLSQENEIDITAMRHKKCAVYIILPDEKETYNALAGMLIQEIYTKLVEEAQYMQRKGDDVVRCNFILDEFANLPRIKDINAKVSAGRSREIRFLFLVQGLAQLKMKYGEEAHNIIGNCNNIVYLNSREYELLDYISKLCGDVEYYEDEKYVKPLISTTELQNLSKDKGETLMLLGRNRPFMTQLPDIDLYDYPMIGNLLMKRQTNVDNVQVLDSSKILNNIVNMELARRANN